MRVIIFVLLIFIIPASAFADGNTKITSFRKAKKIIAKLYQQHQITFYCGCNYDKKTVDHSSCGYKPKRPLTRKGKINKQAQTLLNHKSLQHIMNYISVSETEAFGLKK